MIINNNYEFEVSLSTDFFTDKTISGAMIGSTKNEENRQIRKEYGFPANKGIGYTRTTTTAEELLNNLLDGYVFCHLFNPTKTRTDGSFGTTQKKDENFVGSYVIGVDIDKTNYETADAFVSTLSCKPTFYYTTYSNLQADKGARFRLIYVFDKLIPNPYYFRYVAWNLNNVIVADSGEEIEDDCNLRCSQYFNGTNRNNPNIILSSGLTNNIYSFEDFNVTTDGYIDFLKHYCYYKTVTCDKVNGISKELYNITNNNYSFKNFSFFLSISECQKEGNDENEVETISYQQEDTCTSNQCICCNKELVSDMQRLDYDEFMKYNRHKYNYFYRVEKDNWTCGIYQEIDENYFALYYNAKTVKDGNKRRKKLFERMCLRRVIMPSVDADTLLFNAYEDVHRFFEIDKDLTIDCLARNVENAMSMTIEQIQEKYSDNIAYLKSKAPKSGIIIRRGISDKLAYRNEALKLIRWNLIADYYDTSLGVKENLAIINENLFPISERTLYRYIEENHITIPSKSLTDEDILGMLDLSVSAYRNYLTLKDSGIKVSKDRIYRIYNNTNKESSIQTISTTYYNGMTKGRKSKIQLPDDSIGNELKGLIESKTIYVTWNNYNEEYFAWDFAYDFRNYLKEDRKVVEEWYKEKILPQFAVA